MLGGPLAKPGKGKTNRSGDASGRGKKSFLSIGEKIIPDSEGGG